jgi:methylated-DNA-[protein]-cysteine S-methyltransferase
MQVESTMDPVTYDQVETAFGTVGIVWRERDGAARVRRVFLPRSAAGAGAMILESFPAAARGACAEIDRLAARVRDFLAGHPVEFNLRILDLTVCPSFQGQVLLAEAAIPRGWTSTYGRIARHLGRPGAARAVGSALARNPFPVIIPCHRAVRSDGRLGGYQGGAAMKRALLENEGHRFSADGTILDPRIYY